MAEKIVIIVTSIAAPNTALTAIAAGARERNQHFYVIGDVGSPKQFSLEGCEFFSLQQQLETGFRTAELSPKRHYARKNIGYLQAIREGADVIVETDDDNVPLESFWLARERQQRVRIVEGQGWTNVYSWFSEECIWPRGLPVDTIRAKIPLWDTLIQKNTNCPIQQGLADQNPDVDAIYRLVLPLPVSFRRDRRVALGSGSWCPFNSQNTSWWPEAYPLLYLPAYCSFRMTDIWRSFVAQRIAWANGWSVLFHEPTVYQDRNEHDLLHDFAEEVPGYLQNRKIATALEDLEVSSGLASIPNNLRLCYEELIRIGVLVDKELDLVNAWLADLQQIAAHRVLVNRPSDS